MFGSPHRLTAAVLLASLLALAGCGTAPAQPTPPAPTPASGAPETPPAGEPFVIGVSGDFSGPAAFFSKPFRAGLNTYVHYLNSQGGVHGRPLKVEALDSGLDVPRAVTNIQELVNRNAISITGGLLSQAWNAAAPLADRLQVPQIAPSAADNFADPPNDFRYLTMLAMADQAELNVRLIADLAREAGVAVPKVALFTVDTAAAKDYRDRAVAAIEQNGWQLVDNQTLPGTATDVAAQAASIVSKNPDYVLAYLHDAVAPLAVEGLRQRGMNAPIVNYSYGSSEALFESLADENFYALRDFVWPTADLPAAAEMRQRAEAAGETADMTGLLFTNGYVTGMLLEAALQRCGAQCDGPGLNRALESISGLDTGGLSGPLGFSPTDHRMVDYGRLYRWNSAENRAEPISDWTRIDR